MTRFDLSFIMLGIKDFSNIQPKNIVEIGSRDGHDAECIRDFFQLKQEDCYIFEPNPYAINFIKSTYPKMNLYNNAINDISGTFDFHIDYNNIGASSLLSKKISPSETVKVECLTMESCIDEIGFDTIDIAKIDVEGATVGVLKSFGKHLNKLQSLQIECEHKEIWEGQKLYPEIKEWLIENGFVEMLFANIANEVQSDSFWLKKDRIS